jgi:threonine aldolase
MAFPDGIADFRSDTVTRPTPEMLAAMASAPVGDDVYGEDPTVNELEAMCAELLGKQAGLFTPSGSMGNQVALNVHTTPGQEVVCGDGSHVRNYERGAPAILSGLQFRNVATDRGRITPDQLREVLEHASYHRPDIGLLVWENTHHVSGGRVVPADVMAGTSAVAASAGVPVHLDGARLFNAVAASGTPPDRYAASVDSVQFCFSKALGAPIGSMLVGTREFIASARKVRARLGGGMRQVGVIAAAARVALERRAELAADHAVAARLAAGIAKIYPDSVDVEAVETNMVMVNTTSMPRSTDEIIQHLAQARVRVGSITPTSLRFVTHHQVDDADADAAVAALESL